MHPVVLTSVQVTRAPSDTSQSATQPCSYTSRTHIEHKGAEDRFSLARISSLEMMLWKTTSSTRRRILVPSAGGGRESVKK